PLTELHSFPTRRSSDLWRLSPLRYDGNALYRAVYQGGRADDSAADLLATTWRAGGSASSIPSASPNRGPTGRRGRAPTGPTPITDRKSTRLNSSHSQIS